MDRVADSSWRQTQVQGLPDARLAARPAAAHAAAPPPGHPREPHVCPSRQRSGAARHWHKGCVPRRRAGVAPYRRSEAADESAVGAEPLWASRDRSLAGASTRANAGLRGERARAASAVCSFSPQRCASRRGPGAEAFGERSSRATGSRRCEELERATARCSRSRPAHASYDTGPCAAGCVVAARRWGAGEG
eukprot:364323-Chlamydomonas_euryale.AAC.21